METSDDKILINRPFLPSREQFDALVDGIWERNWLTNNGPLVQEFEAKTASYLKVPALSAVGNGTLALQLAYRALGIRGEVVTTPFTYIATSSSLIWEGSQPVFADIDRDTFTVSVSALKSCITDKTQALCFTHVFGNPCDVEAIEAIAKRAGIPVIYDAAHAFGVTYKGKGLLSYGDAATISFHATKLFHTVEGGGIVTGSDALRDKVNWMRGFGHDGPDRYHGVGINAKMSEMHAAMGLANFGHVNAILESRRANADGYRAQLGGQRGLSFQQIRAETEPNDAYFPVLFDSETTALRVKQALAEHHIFARRYFYPSLDTLEGIGMAGHCPVSRDVAASILCLPTYHDLSPDTITRICEIVTDNL